MNTTTTRPTATAGDVPYPFEPTPRLLRRLRRQKKLKAADAEVLGVLLDFRLTYRDSCWCTKKVIARELGISERTVQYRLERLEQAGVIRKVQVSGPHQEDPDEPRNRTGWRIYFLFITERTNLDRGTDRRDREARKRRPDACNEPPEVRQLSASPPAPEVRRDACIESAEREQLLAPSPAAEREQLFAPSEGATSCFESEMDPQLETRTTTTLDGGAGPGREARRRRLFRPPIRSRRRNRRPLPGRPRTGPTSSLHAPRRRLTRCCS